MARAGCLALALLAAAGSAGCGEDDSPKPVSISLVSPADGVTVHEDAVEVRGRVRPADARVLVGVGLPPCRTASSAARRRFGGSRT